jgi:hypothetical protein
MGGRNGCQTSLHLKFVHNVFMFYDVCYSMSEESVLEKLQRIAREAKAKRIVECE